MRAIRDPVDTARFAAPVIRRHLPDPAYRVLLFGSRATCSARERSDIDIGIEGPAPVSRAALAAIPDELEEAPTLYTIEVVDFRARFGEVSPGLRTSDCAVTKAQSLRADFEKAVARAAEALALPKDPVVRDSEPAVRDFIRAMLEVPQGVLIAPGLLSVD